MKKQVTFSESQMVHGLLQEETFPRRIGMSDSKMALNFNEPAKRCGPQLQDVTTIQIPKTMTTAPFLKHTALTPAQKEFLYTIAASYSTAHVRHLINQHYMNVLHRCITAGHDTGRDDVPSPVNQPSSEGSSKHGSQSQAKHKEKINRNASNSGKSPLPKAPGRQSRFSNTSASKQRNEKNIKSASVRRKSPKRGRLKLQQQEQKEEEDDSLSECLSSLFMEEWDDDTFPKL